MLEKAEYSKRLLAKGNLNEDDALVRLFTKAETYVNKRDEDFRKGIDINIDTILIDLTVFIANIRKLKSANSLNKLYLNIQDELDEIKSDLIHRLEYYKSIYNDHPDD